MSEDAEFKWPTRRLKNQQFFEICDIQNYHVSYGELAELGIEKVLQNVQEVYSKPYDGTMLKGRNKETGELEFEQFTYPAKNPSREELDELGVYLSRFIEDVDDHFKWENFFLYEWYYPFRNKIYRWIRDFSTSRSSQAAEKRLLCLYARCCE